MLKNLTGCGNTQTFNRDAFGQITQQTQLVNQNAFSTTQQYAYDNTGKLISRSLPTNQMLNYGYDANQQMQSIHMQRPWLTRVATLTSPSTAQNIANLLPNSWTQTTLISQVQQQAFNQSITGLQSITHGNGTQTVWSTQQNQPTQQAQQTLQPAPAWVKVSAMLGTPNSLNAQPQQALQNPQQTPIKIDAFGRLSQYTPSTGDNAGKPLTLQWNTANQLITVMDTQSQQAIAHYSYDSQGNRVSKTLYTKTNQPQTTYYAYDNAHKLIAEAERSTANNNVNNTQNTPTITKQYLYTDHRLHSILQGNTLYAVNTDWRGLPQRVTDENKQIVWQQTFDDWGNQQTQNTSNKLSLNIRLAGQYYDAETGLHYNINRYYNPQTGRYISPDPLGTPDGNDRYAYLNGKPHAGIDPLGLFEIPPLAAIGWPTLPTTDGGHGDIVRVAFAQYNAANGMRFSQAIIDQIIRNNYNTDDFTALIGGGGGQFIYANHFDNPNNGPMYTDNTFTTLTESYRDNVTVNGSQNSDNWIQNALDQINANRGVYNQVSQNNGKYDISTIIGRFGQNTHTLADFYAHSNWVDAAARGGKVCQELKGGKIEEGYVPYGLSQTTIWDEQSNMENIYTGTVDLTSDMKDCTLTALGDIGCTADKTTHGYWNKDSASKGGGAETYTTDETAQFTNDKMFLWEVQKYDPSKPIGKVGNPDGDFGVEWYGEYGVAQADLKAGDRIYVQKEITTRHEMAYYLAVEATKKEIQKLYDAASNVTVGAKTLQEVFGLDKSALTGINYQTLPAKNVSVTDEQKQ